MGTKYGTFADQKGNQVPWPNWPTNCPYKDLQPWYAEAEREIGVSGDRQVPDAFERSLGVDTEVIHAYPMAAM